MTRAEVRELLGEPTGQKGPARIECEGDSEPTIAALGGLGAIFLGGLDEWWEYAPPHYEGLSSKEEEQQRAELAKKLETLSEEEVTELGRELVEAIFSGPSDEAFVVYFGVDGHVEGLRAPTTGPYANRPSTGDYPLPAETEELQPVEGD